MPQVEQENNVDSINFFSNPKEAIKKKVTPMPYRKLAFLGLAMGVGLSIPFSIYTGIEHYFTQKHGVEQVQRDYYTQQINAITPDQFARFVNYMNQSENSYDDEMKLLLDSENAAAKDVKSGEHYAGVNETLTSAKPSLDTFKDKVFRDLNLFQDIYTRVKSGHADTVSEDRLNYFLNFYHKSQQGVLLSNTDVEQHINERMYSNTEANQRYNRENGVYDQYETMKKNRSVFK
jgi:hypothetical protein